MIYNINPLILDQGRVKLAMPPLYVLSTRKNTKYLRDQNALDDMRVDAYRLRLDLGVSVYGKPIINLQDEAFRDAIYMIKNVTDKIEEVSRKLAIDPFVVEQLCHCTDFIKGTKSGNLQIDLEGIKKLLELDDCLYSKNSKVLTMVYQELEVSVPLDRLMNEINIYLIPLLESVNWRHYDLYVSTKLTNTYKDKNMMFWQIKQVLDVLDRECDVRRIKGLGECTADELKYTCLDPATRTVVTIYGLGDVDTIFAMLGVDSTARKQLVSSDMDAIWKRGEL
jgi:DNA gyrase/topoisomerase IV subunit B